MQRSPCTQAVVKQKTYFINWKYVWKLNIKRGEGWDTCFYLWWILFLIGVLRSKELDDRAWSKWATNLRFFDFCQLAVISASSTCDSAMLRARKSTCSLFRCFFMLVFPCVGVYVSIPCLQQVFLVLLGDVMHGWQIVQRMTSIFIVLTFFFMSFWVKNTHAIEFRWCQTQKFHICFRCGFRPSACNALSGVVLVPRLLLVQGLLQAFLS